MDIVFSGIQPSGELHIGNLLGAVQNWVRLGEDPKQRCIFSIVDLHAQTQDYDPKDMPGRVAEMAADLIACGVDPSRVAAFERVLFEFARPKTVVLTTPNAEYNVKWESLPAGAFRHRDHRFEWTRAQFQTWAAAIAERFGYKPEFLPVGPVDPELGPPTQMAVFTRHESADAPHRPQPPAEQARTNPAVPQSESEHA